MPSLFIYLIKANIALTLFYLAYRFGLRRLTFYSLNRYFLLIGIAFSAFFPLVNVNTFFQRHEQLAGSMTYYALDWNTLQQYMVQQDPFTWWNALQYIFWTGVVVMVIRFVIQLFSLLRIHLQSMNGKVNNVSVKLMRSKTSPFSFFKNIYINPSLHSPEELNTILIHEKIHIKEWHSIDVIAGEINNIFYWFNPGAWLMKTAIRENLEFITDRKLLRSGINVKSYQYSLLKTIGVLQSTQLANNFNFDHLKHRILMMNKKRSSEFHLFRYLLLLPVIAIVALVITSSRGQDIQSKKNGSLINIQRQKKDTVPLSENSKLSADYNDFLRRNPSVISLSRVFTKNNKAQAIWVTPKKGPIEIYHLDNQKEMKAAEAKYGKFPSSLLPTATKVRPQVKYTSAPQNALYIINGKIIDKKDLKDIDVSEIDSISILKGKSAKEKYGEKGKNGVIEYFIDKNKKTIRPKIHFTPPKVIKDTAVPEGLHPVTVTGFPNEEREKSKVRYVPSKVIKDTAVPESLRPVTVTGFPNEERKNSKVQFTPPKVQTHTIYNGNKPYSVTTFNKVYTIPTAMFVDTVPDDSHVATLNRELDKALLIIDNKIRTVDDAVTNSAYLKENFNPEDLNAISILKGQSAVEKYDQKAKDGAIEIYTKDFVKKHPKWHPDTSAITAESKAGIIIDDRPIKGNPIYIVDGHVADSAFINQLKGKDIRSISVLKGTKAVSVYGKKAKDGAIIITTKEYAKKHSE